MRRLPENIPIGGLMRPHLVLVAALLSSCSSSVTESTLPPGPDEATGAIPGCYSVVPGGTPSRDVSLPSFIELTNEPATLFVDPGRFLVKEPGVSQPRAPISWWEPGPDGTLLLVLGGGYTGYGFSLRPAGQGSWSGTGAYFADMGLEPTPGPLPMRLRPRSCT